MAFLAVSTVQKAELFDGLRGRLEASGGVLSDMVLCPECFSFWAALWSSLVVLNFVPTESLRTSVAASLVIWMLAVLVCQLLLKGKESYVGTTGRPPDENAGV